MFSKEDFSDRKQRVSRTQSLFTDSFKMGASLLQNIGGNNKSIKHLNLQNIKFVDKTQYEQKQQCGICFIPFNKINRRHHCRICAKSCCGDCSNSTINKQRTCDVCIALYLQPQNKLLKQGILQRLKIHAIQYIQGRLYLQQQYKQLQFETPNPQQIEQQKNSVKLRLSKIQNQIEQKRKIREQLEKQLENYKLL